MASDPPGGGLGSRRTRAPGGSRSAASVRPSRESTACSKRLPKAPIRWTVRISGPVGTKLGKTWSRRGRRASAAGIAGMDADPALEELLAVLDRPPAEHLARRARGEARGKGPGLQVAEGGEARRLPAHLLDHPLADLEHLAR